MDRIFPVNAVSEMIRDLGQCSDLLGGGLSIILYRTAAARFNGTPMCEAIAAKGGTSDSLKLHFINIGRGKKNTRERL